MNECIAVSKACQADASEGRIFVAIQHEIYERLPHWIGGVPDAGDVRGLVSIVAYRLGIDREIVQKLWDEVFSNGF
ncbi:MAG: hypothetical protein IE938_19340 [Pseudomonas balearica]|jgi:hypothetical protein|nr:hypothetical protein [Stutzerimonas balearica]